jgi:predicted SnoaL-like aldol condensation-catalyzing enzyme
MATRKEIAIEFLQKAAAGKLDPAYSHVAPNFKHHNPYFPGDAKSLKAGMAEAAAKFPNTTLEVQHVFEDGDLVAVHSRVSHGPDQPEIAVVHMFRFEDDQIAELWDVGMEAPKESPNENGMF